VSTPSSNNGANDLFLSLTPERVLEAVEAAGLHTNPVCYALNSYENRVYEVELEDRSRIIAKFYRPSRWTIPQILEEHRFLQDLEKGEIPVCDVLPFPDGETLKEIDGIFYSLFRRMGGRAPDEITPENAGRLGMLLARIHAVGVQSSGGDRWKLTPEKYIGRNVEWLMEQGIVPIHLESRLRQTCDELIEIANRRLSGVAVQRIHGDFHQGNLIERSGVFHVLDFDDMVVGPPVQDVWLLMPGRDDYSRNLRSIFLEGYETFRPFDYGTLSLIEPLRAMRLVHYATWLARRWHDPVFPVTWPHFGTEHYWQDTLSAIEETLVFARKSEAQALGIEPIIEVEEEELTNKDFFWDMED